MPGRRIQTEAAILELHEESDLLVVKATGRLSHVDYQDFVPLFEEVAARRGQLPLLIHAIGLEGWEGAALWDDIKFNIEHQDSFGPIAVVGDERWLEWGTWFVKPFFRSEMRYFHPDGIDEACVWLRQAAQRAAP